MRTFVPKVAMITASACLVIACAEPATTTVPSSSGPSTTAATATTGSAPATAADGCAHVIDATIDASGEGSYTISATVASADTGEDKYADFWEVRAPDGTVIGKRALTHPHVSEQPFTRSLPDLAIPSGTASVVIVAHDSVAGFCGAIFELDVPDA